MVSTVQKFANSATAKVALATALAFGAAANAQTLPPTKGCHSEAVLQPLLDNDGQKPIFIGRRADAEGKSPGNLFYMNNKGYGYNVERNPINRTLCVVAYTNIKLNYPDNSTIPTWGKVIRPSNGIHPENAHNKGGRFVFMATGFDRDANGNEILGNIISIMAGANKLASVWVINAQNIPDALFDMHSFGIYTNDFNYFMGRGFGSAETDARDRRDGTQAPRPDN